MMMVKYAFILCLDSLLISCASVLNFFASNLKPPNMSQWKVENNSCHMLVSKFNKSNISGNIFLIPSKVNKVIYYHFLSAYQVSRLQL